MGRTRDRLISLIEAEGFEIKWIEPAKGYWRNRGDCYRWEAGATTEGHKDLPGGISVSINSWATMTDCVRRGVTITRDDKSPTSFEVWVRAEESEARKDGAT